MTRALSDIRAFAASLAADGSVAVPPDALAALGWAAGDALVVESDGDSLLVRRPSAADPAADAA
ncbi:MAG: hypothetical protein C0501_21320 [Isosphaera sp.]|nr:hypothetical protein [Isosphaera sp.]